jgi:hypothetical protein
MKLEREGFPLFELEVVHVRLRGDFQILLFYYFLIGVANYGFERYLPDGIGELFPDHCGGRFTRPEPATT